MPCKDTSSILRSKVEKNGLNIFLGGGSEVALSEHKKEGGKGGFFFAV